MENERVNRSNNSYRGKKTEGGYQGQHRRNANGGNGEGTGNRKGQKNFSHKDGGDSKPYFKKKPQGSNGGYGAYFKDKDSDEDYGKKHELKRKVSSSKEKIKEIQPDKADIAKRFEKEKKVMQKKKQDSKKNHQPQRPQMKAKRSNNIDWTREYENDSYDDDDMSYYY